MELDFVDTNRGGSLAAHDQIIANAHTHPPFNHHLLPPPHRVWEYTLANDTPHAHSNVYLWWQAGAQLIFPPGCQSGTGVHGWVVKALHPSVPRSIIIDDKFDWTLTAFGGWRVANSATHRASECANTVAHGCAFNGSIGAYEANGAHHHRTKVHAVLFVMNWTEYWLMVYLHRHKYLAQPIGSKWEQHFEYLQYWW